MGLLSLITIFKPIVPGIKEKNQVVDPRPVGVLRVSCGVALLLHLAIFFKE